jgi:hypothetical protein
VSANREVEELWRWTLGDPRIRVAVLDGPVDLAHPSLARARLTAVPTLIADRCDVGPAGQHGTHLASVIFGRHDGPVQGVAPGCSGIVLPIIGSADDGSVRPCSQLDLARAISQAVLEGARIVNVSGGEFAPSGQAHPLLADVVRQCAAADVLIVAAAGNDGCACPHLPAAIDSVLAVGAMDAAGEPLPESNWGGAYERQGILAPGADILGAVPGGGTARRTGTSFATAIVSGVAALLLSLQVRLGLPASPRQVRQALLDSAIDCGALPAKDCRRVLVGRLNIPGAVSCLFKGIDLMNATVDSDPAETPSITPSSAVVPEVNAPPAVQSNGQFMPSACACDAASGAKVYVLGQLGYDLVSEARWDAFAQKMASHTDAGVPSRMDAADTRKLLAHLETHSVDAAALEWTLLLDGTPVYAIRPQGPFAADTYKQLRDFLKGQLDEGVERISVPGTISGSARLLMGHSVPVINPDPRGMYSWSTKELVASVVGAAPHTDAPPADKEAHEKKTVGVRNFLDRVYYGLRNLGMLPQDRALNFAATNAYNFEQVYESSIKEQMELESINVVRSPFCRPGSDCWDVEVYFFYPERQVQTVRKVYRFTVDVSDTVPVTVGPTRSWFCR